MQELTLIVAATRNMGIGAHGTMPWQGLRKEMQYFARVTSRVPPQVSPLHLPPFELSTLSTFFFYCFNSYMNENTHIHAHTHAHTHTHTHTLIYKYDTSSEATS